MSIRSPMTPTALPRPEAWCRASFTRADSKANDGQTRDRLKSVEVAVLGDNRQSARCGDSGDPEVIDADPAAGLGEVDPQARPHARCVRLQSPQRPEIIGGVADGARRGLRAGLGRPGRHECGTSTDSGSATGAVPVARIAAPLNVFDAAPAGDNPRREAPRLSGHALPDAATPPVAALRVRVEAEVEERKGGCALGHGTVWTNI